MVALDEQQLQQRAALVVELRRPVFHVLPRCRLGGAAGNEAAVYLDCAQFAGAVGDEIRMPAEMGNVLACRLGGLDQGLTGFEGDFLAVENEGIAHGVSWWGRFVAEPISDAAASSRRGQGR
jgi:hypothetical protein